MNLRFMVIGNLKGKSEQGEAYFGQLNLAEFCAYLINNTNAEKLVALVPPTKLDLLDGSYNKIKEEIMQGGIWVPNELLEMNRKFLAVAGLPSNRALVTKMLYDHQTDVIFYVPEFPELSEVAMKTKSAIPKIVEQGLIEFVNILEAVRSLPGDKKPIITPIFTNNLLKDDGLGGMKCIRAELEAAHFSALQSLAHAFSTSYRLNIQMSKIPVPYSTDDFDLLLESAIKSCTNSGTTSMYERNGFATTHRENVTFLNAGKNILTVMVFGKPTNLSSLEGNGMEKSLSLIVAKSQPGIDPDEAVIEEIVSIAPTHIIFFQESEARIIEQLEKGGPSNLRENVRKNLFEAWLLSEVCTKFGINFIGPMFENDVKMDKDCKGESRVDAVSQWCTRILQLSRKIHDTKLI